MKQTIYQVLPRLWRRGKFSDWNDDSFDYLKKLSVDWIWYTGVIRHASGKPFVKGDIGSPYAIEDYYDVNPYLADNEQDRMGEFESLIKRTHDHGFKAMIDFVPNHVAPSCVNDIPLCGWHDYDWTDTVKIDYGAPAARDKMTEIVLYWASKGVDGVRCDMVELVPLDFWRHITAKIKEKHPGFIFLGEAYELGNYEPYLQAGFDLLYDKSGLYDTLKAISDHRQSANAVTWNWQRLGRMQPRMLNFLENHDEQRRAIPSNAAAAVSALFNTAWFMLYFGEEIGEDASDSPDRRTSIFNRARMIDPLSPLTKEQKSRLKWWRTILAKARLKAFREGGNWDLQYFQTDINCDEIFAFLRGDYLVVANFSDSDFTGTIRIPVEAMKKYRPSLRDGIKVSVGALDALVIRI